MLALHQLGRRALFAGLTLGLSACVSVPRDAAVQLAKAGQTTAAASATSLSGAAAEVSGLTERNLVRFAIQNCLRDMNGAPANKPPLCEPGRLSDASARADEANRKLAVVMLLRMKAVQQLGEAYGAMKEEADYDARGELETALDGLTTSANALSTALVAVGAPALPALTLLPIAKRLAGESAAVAQRRRLKEASAQLRQIDERLIVALEQEQAVFKQISAAVLANRNEVADVLLANGIADPIPLVTEFSSGMGLGAPATLSRTDPRTIVAARTLSAYRGQRAVALSGAAYDGNLKALRALVTQHRKFEAEETFDAVALAGAIDELAGWADLIKGLNETATPPKGDQ